VQLQRSHTPSNTPSSHIHTTSWSTTQPVLIPPHAPHSHIPHSIQQPLHNAADNQGLTQDKFVTTPLSPSNRKHLPPHTYNLILCDPTDVDPLTYALPPNAPPGTSSQKRLRNAAKTEIITQEQVTTLASLYYSQIHTVLLSATQPASISSYPSPTHNTYSLILVSHPASISPHTHPTHSTY